MAFVDSARAGKRLCVRKSQNGGILNIVPMANIPQEDIASATAGCEIIMAGAAVNRGYLTYAELKQMFPTYKEELPTHKNTPLNARKELSKVGTRTFITRWGLTNDLWPTWKPLADKGKVKEHTKDYSIVEERTTVFQTQTIGGETALVSVVDQSYRQYRPGA